MALFDKVLAQVLKWEGGFSDDSRDPGGATAFGITTATYHAWLTAQGEAPRPVRDIRRSEVETIYYQRYWLPVGGPELPPPLAMVVMDAAVNSGVGRALGWLAVTKDWRAYNATRLDFLTGLEIWPSFGRGWTRRVADLTRAAAALENEQPTSGKLLLVFDESQTETARVPIQGDVLIRVRGDKVFVRPDP